MTMFAIATPLASATTFAGVRVATAPSETVAAGAVPAGISAADEPVAPAVVNVDNSGCDAVLAAGKAPPMRDNPGYRESMDGDGDGDGVACEPVRDGGYSGTGDFGRNRRR